MSELTCTVNGTSLILTNEEGEVKFTANVGDVNCINERFWVAKQRTTDSITFVESDSIGGSLCNGNEVTINNGDIGVFNDDHADADLWWSDEQS